MMPAKLMIAAVLAAMCAVSLAACARGKETAAAPREPDAAAQSPAEPAPQAEPAPAEPDTDPVYNEVLRQTLEKAGIPAGMAADIEKAAADGPAFILDLLSCMEGDPFLYRLVDKTHPLPAGYAPDDLVTLKDGGSYTVSRQGLKLRAEAAQALETMAAAARADGVTLQASSTYRSYDYQVTVYNRVVAEMGQETADRESARPGYSQHQTGLVVDFGTIDDSFADTPAGRWLAANAGRYGWSLSFPQGCEAVTGYRWECWHYRYVGTELAAFIDTWFGGIQQYALQFIHEYGIISNM